MSSSAVMARFAFALSLLALLLPVHSFSIPSEQAASACSKTVLHDRDTQLHQQVQRSLDQAGVTGSLNNDTGQAGDRALQATLSGPARRPLSLADGAHSQHASNAHSSTQPARPSNSIVTAKAGPVPDWVRFERVLMRSTSELLVYALDDAAADTMQKGLPDMNKALQHSWWKRRDWPLDPVPKITVVPPSALSHYPDTCYRWVEQPTIWYSVISVDDRNFYHWITDNVVPLLYTLETLEWFNMRSFLSRKHLPSSEEAKLMILQFRPWALTAPWYWLLPHLTPDIFVADQMVGSCFQNLTLGLDSASRLYTPVSSQEHLKRRMAAFATFRHFAIEATLRTHSLRNWPALELTHRRAEGRRKIGWVSRRRTPYGGGSRAVINEDDVVAALRKRFDADVSMLYFNATLGEAMQAVQPLDVLVGLHGAGMTNMLWMTHGAAVIQLIPYGWQSDIEGDYPTASLFKMLAEGAGLKYLTWVNDSPQHAFFTKSDFRNASDYVEHPDASTPLPGKAWRDRSFIGRYWQYQDTVVDIDTLVLVVEEALQLAAESLPKAASSY